MATSRKRTAKARPATSFVGGSPCQSFSVAGQRAGLDDPRGVLAIEFCRLARALQARWMVWENVPGVLSHDGGRTFGEILRVLAKCGYGFAYRVLDAQHFGVPQRRRRVFVVGHLGDWRRAAAVLFESESLRRDPTPRREARQDVAGTLEASSGRRNGVGITEAMGGQIFVDPVARCLVAHPSRDDGETENFVTGFHATQDPISGTVVPCLNRKGEVGVCFGEAAARIVRRLTPLEKERLMGFPDGWTAIPRAKDGPRGAALGNSMAVPVVRWIGERIQMVGDHCGVVP